MYSPLDRRVPCPYCGAAAGQKCQDAQGDRVNWQHAVRMTDAANTYDPKRVAKRIEDLERRVAALEAK